MDVASGNAIEAAGFNLTFDGAGTNRVLDSISLGAGGLTKIGSGTTILAAANSYSGATDIRGGRLTLSGNGRLGSGAITISNANTGTLELAVTGTNVMANNISGGGALVSSAGETRLTASNNFTGATAVTGGVLNLNSSAGSSLGSTASVSVTNATLLVSQSNQVSDSATVTLSGGTIKLAGAASETFGNLTVSSDSFLDFGNLTGVNMSFGTYTPTQKITINNFTGLSTLVFKSDMTSFINDTTKFSFANGFNSAVWNSGTSTFTITAIPEPSTILAAIGLAGVMLWPARRRLLRMATGSREG
jgi:autotransporter-associated beta strand protein